jgi:tRNA G46 methylase TrmB
MVLLNRHIRPGSISAVFVNHPEPPQQRSWGAADGAASGDAASEASHMCDKAFFVAVRAALGVGGRFTIVTDNEW